LSISSLRGDSAESYKISGNLGPSELLGASRTTADLRPATNPTAIAPVARNTANATSGTVPSQPRSATPPSASAPARKPRHHVKIVFDSRDMPPEQASHLTHRAPQHTWPRRPSAAAAFPPVAPTMFPQAVSPPDFMGLEGFMAQRVAPPSCRRKFDGLGGDGLGLGWDAWEDW
jgi:hypothetical protein